MKNLLLFIIGTLFLSCQETEKERANRLVREWDGKEVVYPNKMNFTTLGKDTNYSFNSEYTIVTYIDSVGCSSCKLQLPKWRRLIAHLDSISDTSVLFFLHPKDKNDMNYILEREYFAHPVCFDEEDAFNKLNQFPSDMMFQTFLLDKDNKVIAIGNPVHNPKVKELYLKIILGDKAPKNEDKIQTTVACSNTLVDMGKFDWKQEQNTHFTLKNTGNCPLVIIDAVTSCRCTSVEYTKEPVRSGSSVELKVCYKADHPERFNKTITVYCNTPSSLIKLEIKGNAE